MESTVDAKNQAAAPECVNSGVKGNSERARGGVTGGLGVVLPTIPGVNGWHNQCRNCGRKQTALIVSELMVRA